MLKVSKMRACRTCLSKYDLCPLFGQLKFSSDELFLVTGLKMAPDDGLPQTACKSCVKTITKTLHLRELSSKADEFLQSIAEYNAVKTEQNEEIIENFTSFSKGNFHIFNSHNESDDINDCIASDDDIKPNIENDIRVKNDDFENDKSNNTLSNNDDQVYETEFVNIQTKQKHAECDKDKKTKTRNCITLSEDAQIMLYPTKDGSSSNNIPKTTENGLQTSTVVLSCKSLGIDDLAKTTMAKDTITNKAKHLKYVIKCNVDNLYNCKNEICQTILKNKLEKDPGNVVGQTASISSGTAMSNICSQGVNVLGTPSNISSPIAMASGQIATSSGHTATSLGQITTSSGHIATVSGCTAAAAGHKATASDHKTNTSDLDSNTQDFISNKEIIELFKDAHKFGNKACVYNKKTNISHPAGTVSFQTSKISSKIETPCQIISSNEKNFTSQKELHKLFEDRKRFDDDEIKFIKRPKVTDPTGQEDQKMAEEDQDHEDLFENLMSNLKESFAKYIPNDVQETSVIKTKNNIIKPKMDLSRRNKFAERNKELMRLAVAPYSTHGPIQCSVCHVVMQNKHCFRSHALKHFEKQHVCQFPGCGKKFVHRGQLSRHEQCLHGVEKRFSCAHCAYKAADRPTMNNHIRAEHTGETPYECNECGSKFRMRNNIIQHMLVHFKRTKNIQCEFCPALFQLRRDLWLHQDKVHFYTYQFYCYLCPNTYRSACSVKKHLLKVHGVPKEQQLITRRDKIRRPDAPSSSNVKPIVSNKPR